MITATKITVLVTSGRGSIFAGLLDSHRYPDDTNVVWFILTGKDFLGLIGRSLDEAIDFLSPVLSVTVIIPVWR